MSLIQQYFTPALAPAAATPASDSQSAYLAGQSSTTGSVSAYLSGKDSAVDNQSAYLEGYGEILTPDGDISQSDNWQRQDTVTSNLYTSIDEFPESDSDYVWYDDATVGKYFEVSLSNPTGGSVPDNRTEIVWRARRIAGAQSMTIKVELRQGTTVIASQSKVLTDTYNTYVYTLSSGERSSISNWNDLRLRFIVEDLT